MDVFKRQSQREKREIRRGIAAASAADAVGAITPGCEIYGLSKGQFSLVDLLVHCLDATGPADVVCSTWTAAGADIDFALRLVSDGRVKSMRFVVDFSFPARQPAYCAALRERFGDDAIRITKNHAKFVTICNGSWNLVIRTSMNLNENRRMESFEISDDAAMAGYLRDFVDALFSDHAAGSQFSKTPFENCKDFEHMQEVSSDDAAAASAKSGDRGKYFGDGRLSPDLRRSGLSFLRGGRRVGHD